MPEEQKSQGFWHTLPGIITAFAGIITAIAVLIGALNQIGFFKGSSNSNSTSTTLPTPAQTESILSYWLTVQKCPQDKPCEQPFRLSDATATYIFEDNYRVRLNVSAPQPGYFYVLNESLERLADFQRYNILYPSMIDKPDLASLEIAVPQSDWFKFDDKKGTEKLWLVWSGRPLAEVEAVKELANSRDEGKIKDAAHNRAIDELLKKYSVSKSDVEKDETKGRTNIKAKGDVIAYQISLEHR
jgi:hypothetical protein